MQGDPTEGALLVAARKCGLSSDALDKCYPALARFHSPPRKLMSTLHRDQQRARHWFTKGALCAADRCSFEVLGDGRRPLTPSRREEILQVNEALAGRPADARRRRPLGLPTSSRSMLAAPDARRTGPGVRRADWHDRSSAHRGEGRRPGRKAPIRPLMITGDHPRTAAVIAQSSGSRMTAEPSPAQSWRSCRKRNGPERSPRSPSTRASTPNTNCASSRRCGGMERSWR